MTFRVTPGRPFQMYQFYHESCALGCFVALPVAVLRFAWNSTLGRLLNSRSCPPYDQAFGYGRSTPEV